MEVKSLLTDTLVSLTSCESEPIHIPGSIQPHGTLLIVDEELIVHVCSANIREVFSHEPAALLKKSFSEFDQKLADEISSRLNNRAPFPVTVAGRNWHVFIHPLDDKFIIEFEQAVVEQSFDKDAFDHTTEFVAAIRRMKTLKELCQWTADEIRSVTGYDRVMIYRFDEDYNGEVYAEAKDSSVEPFLNLHYPHTDIPAQARELYLRNLMRMIVDVHYAPVPLLADAAEETPDLSDSVLRSVSPIHIQYLKNMNVGATLTISLIHDDRLWGLVACHHYKPKHCGVEQRKMALMHAHFLTSQIKVRQIAEEHETTVIVEAHLQQLLNGLQMQGDFGMTFRNLSSLLAVANASGACILHKGQLYEMGSVPSRERTKALLTWLADNTSGLYFSTSKLNLLYPEGEKISKVASGILYHKLGDPHKDAIIWFREEYEQTINWAGDPKDTAKKEGTKNLLTPRTSFAIFKERVRHSSKPWLVPEMNATSRFASSLLNQFHLAYLQAEESRQRLLNEQLQKANKELANINWITTHDLKEPLRKILLFSSRAMTSAEQELSEIVLNSLTKIKMSATRMQSLVDDITAYSLTEKKTSTFVDTDLNQIMDEVVESFADEFKEKHVSFMSAKLPTIKAIPYQMRQLFINLVGNSIKFKQKNQNLVLEITCAIVKGVAAGDTIGLSSHEYYLIQLSDNGIGFDPAQNEKIFDIFYRLHGETHYPGTGIGLAICKKIVENHNGMITASGDHQKGSQFRIYLPVAEE